MVGTTLNFTDVWEDLTTPPIRWPFFIVYSSFLTTFFLTAVEMASSKSPNQPPSRQTTPSPLTQPPNSGARGAGRSTKFYSDESSPGNNNPPRNNNPAKGRTAGRGKFNNGNGANYGATARSGGSHGGSAAATGTTGVSQHEDSAGGGSSGDNTRRLFYILLFYALLSRIILLPLEGAYLGASLSASSPGLIFARTFPDLAFFTAFSLLVLFYAQLAGTASGSGPRGLSIILLRPGYFRNGNVILYVSYLILLCITTLFPGQLSRKVFQSLVWLFLCVLYLLLFSALAYFGPVLVNLLRPSLAKRSGLAIRLIGMCIICSLIFISRGVSFGAAGFFSDIKYRHGFIPSAIINVNTESEPLVFVRDNIGYTLLEVIPSLAILFMMHQKRPANADTSVSGGGRYSQVQTTDAMESSNGRRVPMPVKQSANFIV